MCGPDPVGPLRREQCVEFYYSPLDVNGARPMDTKAASQLHMCGYSRRRRGHHTQVVAAQQIRGARRELRGSEAGIRCHLLNDRSR